MKRDMAIDVRRGCRTFAFVAAAKVSTGNFFRALSSSVHATDRSAAVCAVYDTERSKRGDHPVKGQKPIAIIINENTGIREFYYLEFV